MLKNHWFYCYFLIYGSENVKKPLVLLLFFGFRGGLARYMDIANKYNKTNGFLTFWDPEFECLAGRFLMLGGEVFSAWRDTWICPRGGYRRGTEDFNI